MVVYATYLKLCIFWAKTLGARRLFIKLHSNGGAAEI